MDAGGVGVTAVPAVLGQFGQGIEFIFHQQASPGGLRVGGSQLLPLLGRHVLVSAVAVAVACVVAIPIALVMAHYRRGELAATTVANLGRALPSLALLAFFVAYLGIGFVNIAAVLALLAIPPILINTYTGVREVDRDVIDAGRGMGMSDAQVIGRLELPIALPLIFAGIRTSAINVVATATLAPLAGYVTLGDTILSPQIYRGPGQIGGAIVVAILAVLTELVFAGLQRAVTPRGLKLSSHASRLRRRGASLPTKRRLEATP